MSQNLKAESHKLKWILKATIHMTVWVIDCDGWSSPGISNVEDHSALEESFVGLTYAGSSARSALQLTRTLEPPSAVTALRFSASWRTIEVHIQRSGKIHPEYLLSKRGSPIEDSAPPAFAFSLSAKDFGPDALSYVRLKVDEIPPLPLLLQLRCRRSQQVARSCPTSP